MKEREKEIKEGLETYTYGGNEMEKVKDGSTDCAQINVKTKGGTRLWLNKRHKRHRVRDTRWRETEKERA